MRSGKSAKTARIGVICSAVLIAMSIIITVVIVRNIKKSRRGILEPYTPLTQPLPEITDFSLWNGYYIYDSGKRVMPDMEPVSWADYVYKNYEYKMSRSEEAAYHAKLKAAGFECITTKYDAFFYSDDAFVFQSDTAQNNAKESDKTLIRLTYFERSPESRGGITEEEVQNMLPEFEYRPIDVTPEGFYEETGIQVFMGQGWYTAFFDKERGADVDLRRPMLYYIYDGRLIWAEAHPSSPTLVSADVDNDGSREVLILGVVPASGKSLLSVVAFRGGEKVYLSEFNVRGYSYFLFSCDDNGCLKLNMSDFLLYPHSSFYTYERPVKTAGFDIGVIDGKIVFC
ncbi:MAG: hypothetical protein J5950_00040 [Clostridia bacterium]|nr:hypothetical protein [Clostridia bacterium]